MIGTNREWKYLTREEERELSHVIEEISDQTINEEVIVRFVLESPHHVHLTDFDKTYISFL